MSFEYDTEYVRVERKPPAAPPIVAVTLISEFQSKLKVDAPLGCPRFRFESGSTLQENDLNRVDPWVRWGDLKAWAKRLIEFAEEHGA